MDMYAERIEKNASEKDKTGIPHKMKAGFERSSGFSFNDVRVHYNSEKPAQLHAHAYTQGNEIYVAPGQEKHLPHELGHVVQQKSDVVRPTGEIGGLPLNDDAAMENDADTIAAKAQNDAPAVEAPVQAKLEEGGIVQRELSGDVYNWTAGLASSILTGAGMIGGIGSFLYTKHNDRKHRYIKEIEKYADAACDAQEEQVAAKGQYDYLQNDNPDKLKAYAEISKLKVKVERNYNTAMDKAEAMGEFKDPLSTRIKNWWNSSHDHNGQPDNEQPDNGQPVDEPVDEHPAEEHPADEHPAEEHQEAAEDQQDNEKINKAENASVKSALKRAKKAYDDSRNMIVAEPRVIALNNNEAQGQ